MLNTPRDSENTFEPKLIMKTSATFILTSLAVTALVGCSSPALRMAGCQAQNISRDLLSD
ncbi:hypothetical protein ACZ87_01456 [Candidatus Erwinia dacicola]|uniref:Uncharacterized protein n=1 Tax=Candidatus Erwinia dacicola TaxID=252393 RepID=A0A328TNC5_9GAMM|nr:hypothetical protein ACZ87_01456 [Candidatus Erwinia dacicola]